MTIKTFTRFYATLARSTATAYVAGPCNFSIANSYAIVAMFNYTCILNFPLIFMRGGALRGNILFFLYELEECVSGYELIAMITFHNIICIIN